MGARWTHAHGLDRLTGADPRGPPACTILDTDIGSFADDTFALGFLLRLPAMALKLVVTASHDTVGRARVAAKHLTLAGADHIPIGVGIKTSEESGALFGWASDYDLKAYRGGVWDDGVAKMAETIEACDGEVALVDIGPHTNVRALLARYPALLSKVRVYAMGGSVVPGIRLPRGAETPVPTTNERTDVPAARAMVGARTWASRTTWAPVATGHEVVIDGGRWQTVLRHGATDPAVKVLVDCYQYWWEESRRNATWITHDEAMGLDPKLRSAILWDAEAAWLAAAPTLGGKPALTLTRLPSVNFTDAGYTTLTPPGAQAYFALAFTEGGRDELLGRLTDVLVNGSAACRGSDGRACEAAGVS